MKIKKILLINFILCFFIFIAVEYFLWHKEIKQNNVPFIHSYIVDPVDFYDKAIRNFIVFRPVVKDNSYVKRPIVLFGCSYTYGVLLNDDETFSAKLQNYTKRVVYNKAMSCFSLQNMLYFCVVELNKKLKTQNILFIRL